MPRRPRTPIFPVPTPRTKRLVLQQTSGPNAGLWHIMGTTDQLKSVAAGGLLPDYVPSVNFRSHTAPVGLIKIRKRYVLYRELIIPLVEPEKAFNPAQQ